MEWSLGEHPETCLLPKRKKQLRLTADFEECIIQIVGIIGKQWSSDILVCTAKFEITFPQYKCVCVYSLAISCFLKISTALW